MKTMKTTFEPQAMIGYVQPVDAPRMHAVTKLRDNQRVPPIKHLRKARARLDRLNEISGPERVAYARKSPDRMSMEEKVAYAQELELILRDYDAILTGLMPTGEEQ